MTDLEINKALALAIGWKPEQMRITDVFGTALILQESEWHTARTFNYRNWNVIGPIAERYDLFPMVAACHADQWAICTDKIEVYAETPQKAIALAVIEAHK